MPDGGLYTYCPACQYLDWVLPPELSPYQQEGFPTSFDCGAVLDQNKAEELIAAMRSKLDEFGYTFDFDLDELAADNSADLATQWASLEGEISGTIQKEMTSWPFDPDQEDSDGNTREYSRLAPDYFEDIVKEALEEMIDNFGSDGWEDVRNRIAETLEGLTYDGQAVIVDVGPGEWTGKG